MTQPSKTPSVSPSSLIEKLILFCLNNKLVVFLLVILMVGWGILVAPFDWAIEGIPRSPISVDAIPDLGENQQIVFTKWPGRSPKDIEDQVSYPLTVALMGIPGIKTVRTYSSFGFSTIYCIFEENINFYWSRSRILEKLNSLPSETLPSEVKPSLGPDATGLGQIFWYTLEGRNEKGQPVAGWDLHELRKIQDWLVRFALQSVSGVSEVASVGGFVQEYQIDVDPEKLRTYNIPLQSVFSAIRSSNKEVGARTIEINRVEYVIRAKGYLKKISDMEQIVLKVSQGTPVLLKDVAKIGLGPAPRRGALDKNGAEVVGGVVISRYGGNPYEIIHHIKKKIQEIAVSLPQKRLANGQLSKVTIVPFYDRSHLILETLKTLEEAITLEILVTILVVVFMLLHFQSALMISGMLPLSVLLCFLFMKLFGVDANIVALSGIAIAIGTMVDIGVVLTENILQKLNEMKEGESSLEVVYLATAEVGGAVFTAVSTTVVSFLPVFTMVASEGKLFRPLAYTKTFALLSSLILSLTFLPILAHLFLAPKKKKHLKLRRALLTMFFFFLGILFSYSKSKSLALLLGALQILVLGRWLSPAWLKTWFRKTANLVLLVVVGFGLTWAWKPLGEEVDFVRNLLFVAFLMGGLLVGFSLFQKSYAFFLRFLLRWKKTFLLLPLGLIWLGATIWLGFSTVNDWIPTAFTKVGVSRTFFVSNPLWVKLSHDVFPGLKKEFMPDLDEGSFLFMPTTMPHASMGEALDVLKKMDKAIASIPEVSVVVGKLGRADTALDPAPISMYENIIHYKAKYKTDAKGRKIRQWRPHIQSPKDIWKEILKVTKIPGTTSAPFLQPISARIVMLQSGMRSPLGIKIKAPNLQVLETFALEIEKWLKKAPAIEPATVIADRVVGKPYLEFDIHRDKIARYGLTIEKVQNIIQMAIGGKRVTTTIEGRNRFGVVLRYPRELRNHITAFQKILIPTSKGLQIPLSHLASIQYVRGPQMIKSEDTFLVGYVVFDKIATFGEVEAVESAKKFLESKIASKELLIPSGISYTFAGTFENQVRSEKTLFLVLPLALFLIFILLYLQFRSTWTTSFIFSGILVAWSGGFLLLWCYQQPWFLDFVFLGRNMRDVFLIQPFSMSVAVWVGFIALFGIASDDGVVMATYLQQRFEENQPTTIEGIRETVLEAGARRIRPCLMTTATTLLALLPVLTSSGKGSDIMIPMAIPSFGGMLIELLTLFVLPVLYCWKAERDLKTSQEEEAIG